MAPFGRIFDLDGDGPDVVAEPIEGVRDRYTVEPVVTGAVHVGMTSASVLPRTVARMERHPTTREGLLCIDEPVVVLLSADPGTAAGGGQHPRRPRPPRGVPLAGSRGLAQRGVRPRGPEPLLLARRRQRLARVPVGRDPRRPGPRHGTGAGTGHGSRPVIARPPRDTVIFLGDVALDEYFRTDRWPGSGEKVDIVPAGSLVGGMIANAAAVHAGYGAPTRFLWAMNESLLSRLAARGTRAPRDRHQPRDRRPGTRRLAQHHRAGGRRAHRADPGPRSRSHSSSPMRRSTPSAAPGTSTRPSATSARSGTAVGTPGP